MQKNSQFRQGKSAPIYIFLFCLLLSNLKFYTQAEEESIPILRAASVYAREFRNSIFLREVVPQVLTVEAPASSFGKNWFLEGVLEDGSGGITVFIVDEKNNVIIAPSESDDTKLTILNHNISSLPRETRVTVSNGTEHVVLRFRDNPLRKVRFNSNAKSIAPKDPQQTKQKLANPANPTENRTENTNSNRNREGKAITEGGLKPSPIKIPLPNSRR